MIPDFFRSEWVVFETDNIHLKPGAPKEIQDEYNEWIKARKEAEEKGIDVD
jgi:hypothetical protein